MWGNVSSEALVQVEASLIHVCLEISYDERDRLNFQFVYPCSLNNLLLCWLVEPFHPVELIVLPSAIFSVENDQLSGISIK